MWAKIVALLYVEVFYLYPCLSDDGVLFICLLYFLLSSSSTFFLPPPISAHHGYDAERIVEHKEEGGKFKFLIQWQPSWELISSVYDSPLLETYLDQLIDSDEVVRIGKEREREEKEKWQKNGGLHNNFFLINFHFFFHYFH